MMKKIFFFIAIFSAIFGYKIYINASSYYFVWENTNLTIPFPVKLIYNPLNSIPRLRKE